MKNKNKFRLNKKYFADGILIVFSVLFALFINRMAEDWEKRRDKNVAIENIKLELHRNDSILKIWNAHHNIIYSNIDDILTGRNENLKSKLMNADYFNLGLLTNNKSIIDANLSETAWETAKTTGIISQFDFATTQKLTEVYSLQKHIVDRTLMNIIDLLFAESTQKTENMNASLMQLRLLFNELRGQEYLLELSYGHVKDQLKDARRE